MGDTARLGLGKAGQSDAAETRRPKGEKRDELTERYLVAAPEEQLSLWLQSPDARGELDRLKSASAEASTRRRSWFSRVLGPKDR